MPPATESKTDQFSQLVERLGSATNVLVTVSDSPSVDQLAACIGLTIALNKQGKHATAVFSGKVPSTLEFLQPEKTIETNTNSLRDFIISLDKSKADKLRYKVEDEFVKIFITPYRTSISDSDLEFSQGDFNIDLIITIGVHERENLDGAIVAHGRILHDATVASINTDTRSEIGTINWVKNESSSLCEMVSDLVAELDKSLFDEQIATALLTGMVAETDRFGNEKASPHTMAVSGVLMQSGASTQLISNKLQEPEPEPEPEEDDSDDDGDGEIPSVVDGDEAPEAEEEVKDDDGTFHIDHANDPEPEESPEEEPEVEEEPAPADQSDIKEEDKSQTLKDLEAARAKLSEDADKAAASTPDQPAEPEQKLITDEPQFGGQLTANSIAEHEQVEPTTDALSTSSDSPMLNHSDPAPAEEPAPVAEAPAEPAKEEPKSSSDDQTLTDIEKSVNSLHLDDVPEFDEFKSVPPPPPVDDARDAVVEAAKKVDDYHPQPPIAHDTQTVDLGLEHNDAPAVADLPPVPADVTSQEETPDTVASPALDPAPEEGLPGNLKFEDFDQEKPATEDKNDNPPPPVPPPPSLMPPGV